MKSVAIIGAGPSGLIAARTFLKSSQPWDVAVFDKQHHVGGMWSVRPGEQDKMLNPEMPTNSSRFGEMFSDMSWNAVNLDHPSKAKCRPGYLPTWPRAWQVGRYLQTYAEKNIPRDVLRLNCEVTEAEEVSDVDRKKIRLRWKDVRDGRSHEAVYDHLILASGFFAEAPLTKLSNDVSKTEAKQVHSSRCRNLFEDLAPKDWDGSGNLLVIGGSMSGAEASTALAFQISNKKYAPGAKPWGSPKILHVVPRPFYPIPPLLPRSEQDTDAYSFLPADLIVMNFDRRPPGPINAGWGEIPGERSEKTHEVLRAVVGDQTDLGAPALVEEDTTRAAYIALAAGGMYSEFVRSGLIQPVAGRASSLGPDKQNHNDAATLRASIRNGDETKTIDNIIGVVQATGYTPLPALSFLSDEIKRKLEFDETSYRLPVILQVHATHHPDIPQIGFVGFYEGPFWRVAEMQARYLAKLWSDDASEPQPNGDDSSPHTNGSTPARIKIERDDPTLETLRRLRSNMKAHSPLIPQYWNNDVAGLLESLRTLVNGERDDSFFSSHRKGPAQISRYPRPASEWSEDDEAEARRANEDLDNLMESSATKGLFVSAAAFRGMHGRWNMHRTLNSRLSSMPSGTFTGTAHFHPRERTCDGYGGEYLYVEEGSFVTDNGWSMKASRRYVFRYDEVSDRISSWFVKEDGLGVDYLFLDLVVQPKGTKGAEKETNKAANDNTGDDAWLAKASHPCAPDTYDATYKWRFDKAALGSFEVTYAVTGPMKDYTSRTSYTR